MSETTSSDIRISYDAVGQGRPLMLLHGWCCDRSWWTEPGYIDELRSDYRLVNVDVRGHGASDKPHEATAYTSDALTRRQWDPLARGGFESNRGSSL
jgi:pimeloyl-ACP methyl ester carboxylesterase